jgi:hypothetical protein
MTYLYNVDDEKNTLSVLFEVDGKLYLTYYSESNEDYYSGITRAKAFINEEGEIERKVYDFGETLTLSEVLNLISEAKKLPYWGFYKHELKQKYFIPREPEIENFSDYGFC